MMQINDGIVLPDKASLYLTAIEDAEYKEDKIECELYLFFYLLVKKKNGLCMLIITNTLTCEHYIPAKFVELSLLSNML